jgi:hypothetical protein
MRMIDGVLYCNDGDWVESRSALVEHMDGTLEILYWDQLLDFVPPAQASDKPVPVALGAKEVPEGLAAS